MKSITKSKSSSQSLYEHAHTLAPLSVNHYRQQQLASISDFSHNDEERQMRGDFWSYSKKKKDSERNKKYSLNFAQDGLYHEETFQKQKAREVGSVRQTRKSSLGQLIRRSNGILPSRFQSKYQEKEKRSKILQKIDKRDSHMSNSQSRKHLSQIKIRTKRGNILIENQIKTIKDLQNKVQPNEQIQQNSFKENQPRAQEINNKKKLREFMMTSICVSRSNYNALKQRFSGKGNSFSSTKKVKQLQNLQKLDISIEKNMKDFGIIEGQQQQSLGLSVSAIQEKEIKNQSDFLDESQKQLLNQLSNFPKQKSSIKRGWRKLPSDFLRAN